MAIASNEVGYPNDEMGIYIFTVECMQLVMLLKRVCFIAFSRCTRGSSCRLDEIKLTCTSTFVQGYPTVRTLSGSASLNIFICLLS